MAITLLRSAFKNKLVSVINLLGLTLGIACATIIFLFVQDELRYDQYADDSNHIYRIAHDRVTNGSTNSMATTPLALAPALEPITAIESKARMLREPGGVLVVGEDIYPEQQFCFADPEVASLFSFQFLEGSPEKAFAPNGIVITEKIAKRYFGNTQALGKTLVYRNWGQETNMQVTGVIKDLPAQSHFHFELFVPFESPANLWLGMHGNDWYYSGSAWTYVLTKPGISEADLNTQLNNETRTHLPEELKESTRFFVQPLRDIHLTSNLSGEIEVTGSKVMVTTFFGIGLAILLLACINYMNLATARSAERVKEGGIRKVLGAFRSDLIRLYLSETLILSLISVILAACLIPLLLPVFNTLMGKTLVLSGSGWLLLLILVGLGTGLVAGAYPALYLSKLKPAASLKISKSFAGSDHADLRKILVTLQYAITSILLVAVFTISAQLDYLQNKNLGFDAKETLYLDGYDFRKAKAVKEELKQLPEFVNATTSWGIPGSQQAPFYQRLFQSNLQEENQRMEVYTVGIDYDYIDFFGMQLIEGRNFSPDFVTDSVESILVNETFVKQAGWIDPLGKEVQIFDMLGNSMGNRKVIGVLKDFNFQSLHIAIEPVAFQLSTRGATLAFHLQTQEPMQTLNRVRELVQPYNAGGLITIYFLDQDLNFQYAKERKFNATLNAFTYLAILISCIGLFGLASFSAQRKAKEIAIRKVLGASTSGLLYKFVVEFCVLVVVSFLIAIPVSYYAINEWLSNFTYRISQGPNYYLIALAASLVLSILTVGFHSVRAASLNPVDSLKEE